MRNHMKTSTKITVTLILLCISFASISAVHNVTVSSNTFSPAVLNIEAGDSVIFTNTSGLHNVVADNGSFRCSTDCEAVPLDGGGQPSSGAWVIEITFNTVGSFNYFCEIHGGSGGSGMSGVINVVAPTTGVVHEVRSSNFEFSPDDLEIEVGDFINFINDEGFHNVRADDDSFLCSEGCLGSGFNLPSSASLSNWNFYIPFNEVGNSRYFCEPHGSPGGNGMSGIIRVVAEDNIFTNGFE